MKGRGREDVNVHRMWGVWSEGEEETDEERGGQTWQRHKGDNTMSKDFSFCKSKHQT